MPAGGVGLVCKDPVPSDIEVSQTAVTPEHISAIAKEAGILEEELDLHGPYIGNVKLSVLERLKDAKQGNYVLVTGINPTSLGEGKSTTTIGLSQALGAHLDKKVFTNIRVPSAGPTFGVKGGASGGGYAQTIPMELFNINVPNLQISPVLAANNLIAAAIDARMYHEQTQTDEALFRRLCPNKNGTREFLPPMRKRLAKLGIDKTNPDDLTPEEASKFVRLDIDPETITWKRVVDTCDRHLRKITVGQAPSEQRGKERSTGFDIAVASECMAILALATSIRDLRERLGRIVVAYSRAGDPVTAEDLGVAGAAAVLMLDALQPSLMQTLEKTPVLVHAGPFANIAHGNSSLIADQIALKLVGEEGFVLTEAGFGADIGAEKFFNIKCRASGLKPDCAVIVATVRALKMHGGGPQVTPGKPLDRAYKEENLDLLAKGVGNLQHHVRNMNKFGVPTVCCINRFATDTDAEIDLVRQAALDAGAYDAVMANHWAEGGAGAVDLGSSVIKACADARAGKAGTGFKFLYPLEMSLRDKIQRISIEIYGASGVEFSDLANEQLDRYERLGYGNLPICVAKTHLSLSADPSKRGVPTDFTVTVREARASVGAGLILAMLGDIMTIPGLPTLPGFFNVDVTDDGQILGLF
ncbi:C-1-tetrahydrofolate synthase, cytoplasmic [Hondaea fermentalgiana]|uniref:formate--tetrahydrofolate ligase n=1 Tax=Hondaea fermentalgiana TaxID=2315210 RepID=A0A2R5GRD6_9STRA|nr:C-1-tetrahydrofolate synthase, cytoplasmic [Hondaea fermentalgiana]|eukprot:GBG30444.1 C-1-tetrahydrofolate synthase, cytoplasmic [Hondaea fermentalgiana]